MSRTVASGGWLARARRIPSPNEDARPDGVVVDTLIVHHISLPPERFSGDAVEQFFTNRLDPEVHPYFEQLRGVRVSAHFFVRRRGELLQFVSADRRAWHAGTSRLLDRERCNDFSIGVELEGSGRRPFTELQYRRLTRLLADLAGLYPLRYIAGHSDIAPGRKADPGPWFDWFRLVPALDTLGISAPFRPPCRAIPGSAIAGVENTGRSRRNRPESTR